MKKVFGKALFGAGLASIMFAQTVFAGTWRTGIAPNENRWWYDNDNGTYAQNGWQWLDGNKDGVAECYYFDEAGWMLVNTTTPDGYTVNENGAWIQNGAVQTQTVAIPTEQAQNISSKPDFSWTYTVNADGSYSPNYQEDIQTWWQASTALYLQDNNIWDKPHNVAIDGWAQLSDRGAAWKQLFDYYGIPYDLGSDRSVTSYTYTTPAGMSEADLYPIGMGFEVMLWTNTDGMCNVSWNDQLNADTTITITLEMEYVG